MGTKKPIIICENIRSAYNVGNIIRTADALGFQVILSGFSPHPDEGEKVKKTSLGAEKEVDLLRFWNCKEATDYVQKNGYELLSCECTEDSMSLKSIDFSEFSRSIALLVGNENTGVLPETLEKSDRVVHIPMCGIKESFNVGQAAAIFMREAIRQK